MKPFYVTILLLLSNLMIAVSQTSDTDSLKKLLAQTDADTTRVLLLSRLAGAYRFSNLDTALILSQQALLLSRKLNFTRGEVRALNLLGSTLQSLGEYPKALEAEFEALRMSKSSHDREAEATSLVYIGSIYIQLNEYQQALFYLQQVLKIDECPQHIAILALSAIGDAYEKMNRLDSASVYQLQAKGMLKELPRGTLQSLVPLRLGRIQVRLGNSASALRYYHDVLDNAHLTGDLLNQGRAQHRIAEIYHQSHQLDSSLMYARLAFINCQQTSQKLWQLYASDLLVKLFQEQNKLDSAYYYLQVSQVIKDSLFSPEKFQRLQLLTSIEQQRQREILQAQADFKNKIRLYASLATVGVFLVLAILLYRNNRQKQKANALLQHQKSEIQNTLTELKATQNQLIQSEKMASLGELTAGIAHEIQNPLNFVNNFSEVNKDLLVEMKDEMKIGNLTEANAIADDVIGNEEKINYHGKRADAIVKGMLQHSRQSSGIKELTDINALADEYLRLAYHGLRAKDKSFNATLKTDYDENVGKINIIPQDIGRVILNLITNAFHAVTEKMKENMDGYVATVMVTTRSIKLPSGGTGVSISVKDNGNGIPENVVDKIFQPFFTTKPTGQGTGLGLSLSYDIVKAHGGQLKVETKTGEGSEFIIQLPAN
ncbi:MAG: tetratricopeptide repeat protein [Chitinophagaceae bacterium]|nr:tetratricopeptide repeat protein [Chitinophagaceae bacterium]